MQHSLSEIGTVETRFYWSPADSNNQKFDLVTIVTCIATKNSPMCNLAENSEQKNALLWCIPTRYPHTPRFFFSRWVILIAGMPLTHCIFKEIKYKMVYSARRTIFIFLSKPSFCMKTGQRLSILRYTNTFHMYCAWLWDWIRYITGKYTFLIFEFHPRAVLLIP